MSLHKVSINKDGTQWDAGFIYGVAHSVGVPFDGFYFGYDTQEDEKNHRVSGIAKIECTDAVWTKFVEEIEWRYKGYTNEVEILS